MLEYLRDVRVEAQTVGRERLGNLAVANNVRVAGDGAGEISRALAVDRIGVPDAADVNSVADGAHQFALGDAAARAHHDVGARRAGTRVEAAAAAFAKAVTAQRREVELRGGAGAKLFGAMLVGEHAVGVVEIREQADELAVANQLDTAARGFLRR